MFSFFEVHKNDTASLFAVQTANNATTPVVLIPCDNTLNCCVYKACFISNNKSL